MLHSIPAHGRFLEECMLPSQKDALRRMRENGKSYGQIAAALGLSENTVKSYCRRTGLQTFVARTICPRCGKILLPKKTWPPPLLLGCVPVCLGLFASDTRAAECDSKTVHRLQKALFQLSVQPSEILLPRLLYHRPLRKGGGAPWIKSRPNGTAIIWQAWPCSRKCWTKG